MPVDERDRVVGDLARRRSARLHRPVDRDVQRRALGVVLVHAALEAAPIGGREVVEAEQAAGDVARVVQGLGGRAHVGAEPGPPDRLVPRDRRRPAAGGDRRHRVAGRRRVRPSVLEQRPFRGERVDHGRRRARVPVGADVIGAQRVDRDEQQVEVRGDGVRQIGHPRGRRQRVRRVLAVAVRVGAVARDIHRAGMNQRVSVVAVAATQRARIAVTVEIELPAGGLQRLAHEGGARARDLPRRFERRHRQHDADRREPERDRDQRNANGRVRKAPARRPRQQRRRHRHRRADEDLRPRGEAQVVAPVVRERERRGAAIAEDGERDRPAPADRQARRRQPHQRPGQQRRRHRGPQHVSRQLGPRRAGGSVTAG